MAYDPNDAADKKIVKGLIDAALAEAETEHETAVAGLKTKNSDLIKELREARSGKGKPEDVAALEEQLDVSKAALAKLEKDHKKVVANLEEANTAKETETNFAKDLLIESQLTEQLVTAKVAPAFLPAVKAMLKPMASVKVDDKGRAVVVGEKPLGDFVKEWSQGDQGKVFVGAPVNSGAGGNGGNRNNGVAGKTMTRAEYDASQTANPGSAMAFIKEGGVITD